MVENGTIYWSDAMRCGPVDISKQSYDLGGIKEFKIS
jgi:hypothetical protein